MTKTTFERNSESSNSNSSTDTNIVVGVLSTSMEKIQQRQQQQQQSPLKSGGVVINNTPVLGGSSVGQAAVMASKNNSININSKTLTSLSSPSASPSLPLSSSEDEQFINTVNKIISNDDITSTTTTTTSTTNTLTSNNTTTSSTSTTIPNNHNHNNNSLKQKDNKKSRKKIKFKNKKLNNEKNNKFESNNGADKVNNVEDSSVKTTKDEETLPLMIPSTTHHDIGTEQMNEELHHPPPSPQQHHPKTKMEEVQQQIHHHMDIITHNLGHIINNDLTKKIQEKILSRKKKRESLRDQAPPNESFSIDLGMMWLLKSIERTAIQEHVCERILKLPHTDFQLFLPQIVHVCVVYSPEPIISMLLEKCQQSLVVAVQTFFLLQSISMDKNQHTFEQAKTLWKRCELASVGLFEFALLYQRNNKDMEDSLSDGSLLIDEQYFEKQKQQKNQQQKNQNQQQQLTSIKEEEEEERKEKEKELIEDNTTTLVVAQVEELDLLSNVHINSPITDNNDERVNKLSFSTTTMTNNNNDDESQENQESNPLSFSSSSTIISNATLKKNQLSHSTSSIPDGSGGAMTKWSTQSGLMLASTSSNPYLYCYDMLDVSTSKQRMFSYNTFYSEIHFINILSKMGTFLLTIPDINGKDIQKEMRNVTLRVMLKHLDEQLFSRPSNIILPVYPSFHVLSIVHEDAQCLNSRERVPFMLYLEVRVINQDQQDQQQKNDHNGDGNGNEDNGRDGHNGSNGNSSSSYNGYDDLDLSSFNNDKVIDSQESCKLQTIPDYVEDDDELSWIVMDDDTDITEKRANNPMTHVFGDTWKEKENRVWKNTKFRHVPNWRLISFIVKSGDDLRQEQLAMQLITQFHRIFKKTSLPIWLRPYLVIATGQDSGLIETIPDSTSMDTLKKKCPNYKDLSDYFIRSYGDRTSKRFTQAQTNFIESLAGYSLVCYFLQIKDRHNGNILLDRKGHLIHIDYGFLLTTSPGQINFENAPFKLVQEYIDLMGGMNSEKFNYFKTLLLAGFIQVRKHYQEFTMMIELMSPHTSLKCIRKEGTIALFKERFRLDLKTDESCHHYIEELVNQSIGNWTTSSYDTFQYYTNGII